LHGTTADPEVHIDGTEVNAQLVAFWDENVSVTVAPVEGT
jgi:hypothetical protein